MLCELKTQYDSRKSFYNKATVEICDDRTIKLFSYNTLVAYITPENKAVILGFHSNTTTRHIREFLKQNGFIANNKAQMIKDYC